jgi:2'-5' RNA ligase
VAGDERIRLFCALRLPQPVLDGLERWIGEPPGGRPVSQANMHVTLAFLGSRPADELDAVAGALRDAAAAAGPILLEPLRYRETRSVGMLVLGDRNGHGAALAGDLAGRLERLGVYRPEPRPWLPHVTVLRFRERPRLGLEPPQLGAFAPSDAAAFLSRLRPSGAQYEVLRSFALGG